MIRWTKEEVDFLYEFVQGHGYNEIIQEYKRRFGKDITRQRIKNKLRYLNINTGLDGRFKKGNISPNTAQVGAERIIDGFIEIKIANNNWIKKHRLIYEEYYGVKLDKNDNIVFLDKDKRNFKINNLALVTTREMFYINKNFDFANADVELRLAMIALARANVKLMEAKRSRKG